MRQILVTFVLLAAFTSLCACDAKTFAKDKPVSWKIIDDSLFRVNDAPVKEWGVYQTGKKRDPLLIQMDKRFLLVKIHERQLYEIDPAKVQIKSDELLWNPADHPTQPMVTAEWDVNDTEAVFVVRTRIAGEDRLL